MASNQRPSPDGRSSSHAGPAVLAPPLDRPPAARGAEQSSRGLRQKPRRSITVSWLTIGSALVDDITAGINEMLTRAAQNDGMSKVVITPECINLESPPVMRALLHHLFDHADIVDHDQAGRPILRFEFTCAPWLMDKLSSFNASRADFEPEPIENDD